MQNRNKQFLHTSKYRSYLDGWRQGKPTIHRIATSWQRLLWWSSYKVFGRHVDDFGNGATSWDLVSAWICQGAVGSSKVNFVSNQSTVDDQLVIAGGVVVCWDSCVATCAAGVDTATTVGYAVVVIIYWNSDNQGVYLVDARVDVDVTTSNDVGYGDVVGRWPACRTRHYIAVYISIAADINCLPSSYVSSSCNTQRARNWIPKFCA